MLDRLPRPVVLVAPRAELIDEEGMTIGEGLESRTPGYEASPTASADCGCDPPR